MKKKIGILTFHRADNLGAVLQAYALQSTIENVCNADAEIIDYKCDFIELTKSVSLASFKQLIKYIPMKVYYLIKHRGFEKFRKHKIKTSDNVFDASSIGSVKNNYDVFITGSDQVWNLDCSGNDLTYFLPFVSNNAKKIAFAASLGQYKFKDEDINRISTILNGFDRISVREASGLKELKRIGVNMGEELCDPVVLLSPDQWKNTMAKRLYGGRYVLVYLVLDDVNTLKCAQEYATAHNCKIIHNKKSIEFILHNSPSEFLSWIYYAECVFTNSFHGTAFSLIFNKRLASDTQMPDSALNHRVKEFLSKTNSECCEITQDNRSGNVPNAQEKLEHYRQMGIEFLKDVIDS